MTQLELETVKNQAEALEIDIVVTHYDHNRFSVGIGSHVYTDLHRALSALTTIFLKRSK